MLDTITELLQRKNKENLLNINLLLYGFKDLDYEENCTIFEAVQVSIMELKKLK